MQNKGLTNHTKYHTQFYKKRKTVNNQYTNFIQTTLIQGRPISKTIFTSRQLQQKLYQPQDYKTIQIKFRGKSLTSSRKYRNSISISNNDGVLKRGLIKLVNNDHRDRGRSFLLSDNINDNNYRGYLKMSRRDQNNKYKMKEDDGFRPYTSLNIDRQLQPHRREITLKQKLMFYEKNNQYKFMPMIIKEKGNKKYGYQ